MTLFRNIITEIQSTTYTTHNLYMYPAKFIPQVVRYVINEYTTTNSWLFDPFGGYGTVAIEATLTNRNAILWDLNPMTRLLVEASTYTEPISLKDMYIDFNHTEPFHPRYTNIKYWHPKEFYNVLSKAWGYWHKNVDRKLKPITAIPLLKVTRYFSYSDEKIPKLHRSKRAEEKVKTLLNTNWKDKIEKMYWNQARKTIEKIRDYQKRKPTKTEIIVEASDEKIFTNTTTIVDSTKHKLQREVETMITSPPYLQAQEYIRSFKLELAWLGFSEHFITTLIKHEIPYNNIREGYISSKTYETIKREIEKLRHEKLLELYTSYFNSIAKTLNNINEKITDTIAILVSPTRAKNITIQTDKILVEHLEHLGWKHEKTLTDTIARHRIFKLKNERIQTEQLIITRRQKK